MPVLRKMIIFGIPKTEEQTICKAAIEGISPKWNVSFQNSRQLSQYDCNNSHFITV
jgi:hypothetical protein